MDHVPPIEPAKETEKIASFLRDTLRKTSMKNVIVGMSGGIDSATSFSLLLTALPPEHVFAVHMPYTTSFQEELKPLLQKLPKKNVFEISIKPFADSIAKEEGIDPENETDKLRFGNIMARIRMIILYDLAKKHTALVCGTENKSEYHLGYFTRFGDDASDIEPLRHLFKTQVFQLGKYVGVPDTILKKAPSAGLWEGQTDESEFGFSYEEADQVLFNYFEKGITFEEIEKTMPNAKVIIERVKQNEYKHRVPYTL